MNWKNKRLAGARAILMHTEQRHILAVFIFIGIIWGAAGCQPHESLLRRNPEISPHPDVFGPFISILEANYTVADKISELMKKRGALMDRPMIAASFVNIDDLTQSNTMGRIVSEQISTRLVQHGYTFIELKLRRESVFVKQKAGEFLLSREIRDIASTNDAYAVLVGTYAITENSVFLSARIVMTEDNSIIAGQDYEIARAAITKSLIN